MASLPAQPDKACVTMEKVWETQPHLVTEKSGGGRRPVPWEQLWSTSNSVYGNGLNPETSDATSGNHQMLGGGWHTSNEDYGKGVGTALPARPALNQKAHGTVPQDQHTRPDPYVPSKNRPSTHLPGQTILTGAHEDHAKSSEVTQTVRVEPYPPADYSGAQVSNLRLRTGPLPAPTRQYMEEYCDRLVKNMTSV